METRVTKVAVLMLALAASLGVAAGLHLSGSVQGRASSFDPDAAGVAEAVIGVVMAVGAIWMLSDRVRARTVGIAVNSFALAGFLVGISETASGGRAPDIAYHATVIPLLVISLVTLVRAGRKGAVTGGPDRNRPDRTRSTHPQAA